MKHTLLLMALFLCVTAYGKEKFPDGTTIPEWFYKTDKIDIATLGKTYRITDYGVTTDSNTVQTASIQAVIDRAAEAGGGVIVIPQGTFLSGSLFFKSGTHLHLEEGATLKGSDDIRNFAIVDTRIEGQSLKYFAALVNADGVDGFTITGTGTINGNGQRYWESFWLRRKVIPKCTNMDEMRPRLIYISNCKDVQLQDAHFTNSPFWTTHLYRCENVKILGVHIFAPSKPVKAPSSDAIDIDVCTNVLVKNCFLSVNDDAVALKGGKGPFADEAPENGGNYNIIIEDCEYGFCHSALTCGSESIHDRNIVLRRCKISNATRLLWLKMRPDTPQKYEHILVEDIEGDAKSFLFVKPWTQFFDLKGRKDKPYSYSNNVTMRNIKLECDKFFDVKASEDYFLSDFTFENLDITAKKDANLKREIVDGFKIKNVTVNGEKLPNQKK
ncbi:MAG: exopolygalacturonase [Coprobacter sp.]|nr:exopolygalacturonase [Coprobacter sp.]